MAAADMGEPVGAFAADGGHNFRRKVRLAVMSDYAAHGLVLNQDIFHHGIKFYGNIVLQKVILETGIDLVAFLCSQMADGALDQL